MAHEKPPQGEPFNPIQYTSDVFPTERVDTEVDHGHSHSDAHAPTHANANQSRRQRAHSGHQRPWYHPRPQPRHRMDLMGFHRGMWLISVVLIVLLLFWF